jgi:hypothetical protein
MVTMRRHWLTHGVWLALCDLGCAAIVDFPDDPELVVDPESLESEPEVVAEANWRCLTEPAKAAVPTAPLARVRIQACDALRGCSLPVSGLTGRVCGKLDVDCTNPFYTGTTDGAGALEFDVPTEDSGFDGYLELSAATEMCTNAALFGEASSFLCSLLPECDPESPDARCGVPTHARSFRFFNPPIISDLAEPMRQSMISSAALPGIVRASGATFDPAMGNLIVTAMDCDGVPAPGIHYAMGERPGQVTQLYTESGILTAARNETDATGVGGFAGVPPGFTDVAAYDALGTRIGGVGVFVAPSAITYTVLVPSR